MQKDQHMGLFRPATGAFKFARTLLVVVSALAATGTATLAQEARTITHQLGTTDITGTPTKVVALEYSFIQALNAIGVTPVGIADDDQPARIEQLLGKKIDYTSVGTRLEPNLELVASLQPDLIIADETRHAAIYEQLSAIAPTIVLNSWEGTYDEIKSAVVTIAEAMGDKAKGEAAVAAHEATMADLASKIPAGETRTFLLAVANPDSFSLHTSNSFTGSVFHALNLTPAIEDPNAEATESAVGLERVVAVNPDVLLVATEGKATVFDQWKTNAAFQNISAVKNGLVFEVDRNQFSRFRGLLTAEMMAREILSKVYNVQ